MALHSMRLQNLNTWKNDEECAFEHVHSRKGTPLRKST